MDIPVSSNVVRVKSFLSVYDVKRNLFVIGANTNTFSLQKNAILVRLMIKIHLIFNCPLIAVHDD